MGQSNQRVPPHQNAPARKSGIRKKEEIAGLGGTSASFPLGRARKPWYFVAAPGYEELLRQRPEIAAMTLKSALQDLRDTTLVAISGLLAKLAYLASLRRREGGYLHWGLSLIHGEESSDRALRMAQTEVLSKVLCKPLSELVEDLHESSCQTGKTPEAYVEDMREQFHELLPAPDDAASAAHLNSVLIALSSLEEAQKPATPSTSWQSPRPAR